MNDNLFKQAVEMARAGRKEDARAMFIHVLEMEPTNEAAWLWYADTLPDLSDRIIVLQECLQMIPNSEAAKNGLILLREMHMHGEAVSPQEESDLMVGPPPGTEKDQAAQTNVFQDPPAGGAQDGFSQVSPFTVSPDEVTDEDLRFAERSLILSQDNDPQNPGQQTTGSADAQQNAGWGPPSFGSLSDIQQPPVTPEQPAHEVARPIQEPQILDEAEEPEPEAFEANEAEPAWKPFFSDERPRARKNQAQSEPVVEEEEENPLIEEEINATAPQEIVMPVLEPSPANDRIKNTLYYLAVGIIIVLVVLVVILVLDYAPNGDTSLHLPPIHLPNIQLPAFTLPFKFP